MQPQQENSHKMKKRRRSYPILFFFTNFIFVLLYRRFLFGDGVYLYLDSGSDSMSSSYPIIVLLGRLFRGGDFSSYNLTFGLGNDITATFLQYLNPVKFLLLFFNEKTLPVGIMIMVTIITNLTSLFAFLYFRLILKREDAAFVPALMWTFSGYIVLWSQNLSFGCAMMMVTLTMLLLEHLLQTPKLTWWLALLGESALFLVTNYYFLYITAVFAAIYMILRGILTRCGFRNFFRGFALSVSAVLCSLILAVISIIPIVTNFTGSARSGTSSGTSLSLALGDRLDTKRALTILGRVFSPNTLGIADSYSGSVNYYEAALISTSILALFAIFYLIFRRSSCLKALFITLLCILMLAIPFTGQLMNLNVLSYRYSFVISFAECIAAGFFMKSLLENPDRKALLLSSVLALLTTGAILLFVRISGRSVGLTEESRTLKLIILTTGVWFLFFLAVLAVSRRETRLKHLRSLLLPFSLLLLSGELVVMNNDSLYLRSYVTKDMYQSSLYNNGVRQAVSTLKESDSSLYRSVADATFNFANQGAVDSYPSTTGYFNTNPASMQSYSSENGMFQFSSSFFLSDERQYPQFTLLSGKYLLKDHGNLLEMMEEPSLFQASSASENERRAVFENDNALPFGYLYTDQMSHSDYAALSLPEKMYTQTHAYYETENKTDNGISSSVPAEDTSVSVSELLPSGNAGDTSNLKVETSSDSTSGNMCITMSPQGTDPWIIYHFDTSADKTDTVHFLYLKLKEMPSEGKTLQFPIYYLSEKHPVADKVFSDILYLSADYPELCIMLPDGTNGIRLGIPAEESQVVFDKMEILTTDSLSSAFGKLRNDSKAVQNISYQERTDTYTAQVNSKEDAMFCVPIFITKNWSATINGKPAALHNINGGLIGIPVQSGSNHIVLRYRVPHLKAAAGVSAAGLVLYVFAWVIVLRRNRKRRRNTVRELIQ